MNDMNDVNFYILQFSLDLMTRQSFTFFVSERFRVYNVPNINSEMEDFVCMLTDIYISDNVISCGWKAQVPQ